jgi:hypothetical protein
MKKGWKHLIPSDEGSQESKETNETKDCDT